MVALALENQTFPSNRRLKTPKAFKTVYNGNQIRVKGQYFTVLAFYRVKAVANSGLNGTITTALEAARLGAVASKKVSKLAVQRNRLKRLMRESFRHLHQPEGFDFVIIARPGAAQANNAQLNQELNRLWKKLHRRCVEY